MCLRTCVSVCACVCVCACVSLYMCVSLFMHITVLFHSAVLMYRNGNFKTIESELIKALLAAELIPEEHAQMPQKVCVTVTIHVYVGLIGH